MKTCQEVLQVIYSYLDNEVAIVEMTEIREHMDLCRHCFSYMEFERLLREHMRNATSHQCPEKLRQRIKSLIAIF